MMNSQLPNAEWQRLQRQQEHQQQQQQCFFSDQMSNMFSSHSGLVKPEWAGLDASCAYGGGDQLGYGYMVLNPVANPVAGPVAGSVAGPVADQMVFLQGNSGSVSPSVSVSPKKRKAEKGQSLQVVSDKEKKIKGCSEGDSRITHQNSNSKEASTNTSSKEKSKVSEVQKPDYIHVRARRGQATDSHSLAERVRREKISERMKYLQDLVPGCNKITGKAGMLDEIINYVQSLQKQVEFLSMKLASVNPALDFNIDNVLLKEIFEASTSEFPALGCTSANSGCFQLNSLDQVVSYCGLDMGINSAEMGLSRSINAAVSIPETFMDSSCFNQIQQAANWDADLQNVYKMEFEQEPLIPFPSHQFTGLNEGSNLKTET